MATKIDKSCTCKQFNIPDVEFEDRPIPDILLEALEKIDVYQLVNVVLDEVIVGSSRKQDIIVADHSASTTVYRQLVGRIHWTTETQLQ